MEGTSFIEAFRQCRERPGSQEREQSAEIDMLIVAYLEQRYKGCDCLIALDREASMIRVSHRIGGSPRASSSVDVGSARELYCRDLEREGNSWFEVARAQIGMCEPLTLEESTNTLAGSHGGDLEPRSGCEGSQAKCRIDTAEMP